MKISYLQSVAVLLSLSVCVLAQTPAQARGGHGGHSGGHAGGGRVGSIGPRAVSVGRGVGSGGSRLLARMGFGRGRSRRGYYGGNYGPTPEQVQSETFAERQGENPYAGVPQHVNVSDYVKTY
ncbi:MAG: hypothetical protein JST01_13425 [Cyanobacteria bacterium SZAS TMP-1]|nr:hypothetical protein [Cyanobacteria bacterium SZAS TMP-1]